MDVPEKVYRSLTAKERFRASVDAVMRNDATEAAKLYDTCPIKTYRMPDQDFAHPLRSLIQMTIEHERELLRLALGFAVGHIAGLGADEPDVPPGVAEYERLTGVSADALRGKIAAWKEFCDEIGEDAEGLSRAIGINKEAPLRVVLRVLNSLHDDAPTDGGDLRAEMHASYLRQLRDRWARVTT